ncbi:putative acetyltransferase (GNAT) [Lyophyllum shimeji]|uniref:Acetyltransferase (GNAT) n=1 Tax=Lyophyllum shimeji TaxID=47721 RepID=A0A9P3UQL6_LYOSH|nr:putative acetyltransferase (GNAT) [Lyophyllum shimeji]
MTAFAAIDKFLGVSFPDDCSAQPHVNFNVPLPSVLETPRVKLTPFIPSLHGEIVFATYSKTPELGQYLPISFPAYQDFVSFIENFMQAGQDNVLFAIIDKAKDEADPQMSLAGIIGIVHCNPRNRAAEIGPVIILPAFQRTFVSSNAIGRILKYLLDVPSAGGLGFRRVAWTANPENQASIRAAERMGFRREGILRWTWCLPEGLPGKESGRERGEALGRDSICLAICWDDWENGGKELVESLIRRAQ